MNAISNNISLVRKLLSRYSHKINKGYLGSAIDAGDDAVLAMKGMLANDGHPVPEWVEQRERTNISEPLGLEFDTKLDELGKCLAKALYSIAEAERYLGEYNADSALSYIESSLGKIKEARAIEILLKQQLQKEEGLKIGN